MPQGSTAVVDDEYGLEPAKPAAGASDDEYGLEPAKKPPATKTAAKPAPTGAWAHIKESAASLVPSMPGSIGEAFDYLTGAKAAGGIAEAIKGMPEEYKRARATPQGQNVAPALPLTPQDTQAYIDEVRKGNLPNPVPGKVYAGAAAASRLVPGMSPERQEKAAAAGDTSGVIGENVIPAASVVAGMVAPKAIEGADRGLKAVDAKVAEMRQPSRMANFDSVVRDLAGKTPADLDFTQTLDKVRPDVAEIARKSGFAEKGNARVGEFQRMLDQRAGEIWDEEHKPQVERNKARPIDHEAVAQRARAAISDADRANNPAAARAADRWIESALNPEVVGTVGGADAMIRRINAEVPNLPEPFKVIGKTVRNAAVKGLRAELESTLAGPAGAGEAGVKGPNTRWGALREVSDAIEGKLNNAVNKPLSSWEVIRDASRTGAHGGWAGAAAGGLVGAVLGEPALGAEIGGGIGAVGGAGASVVHDVISQPGGRIARAMKGLGKTNLQPETVGTPGFITNPQNSLVPGIGGPGNPVPQPPETPIQSILPVPQRPVGVNPTLSGPVTNPLWGEPIVQGRPGFDNPQVEVMGPWGAGNGKEVLPPPTKPPSPALNYPSTAGPQVAPPPPAAPLPQAPVGTLPTLSGPVTNPLWGEPISQGKPGFDNPQTELMGPWGAGAAPAEAPPTIQAMKPP